jgi:hypothetical protein
MRRCGPEEGRSLSGPSSGVDTPRASFRGNGGFQGIGFSFERINPLTGRHVTDQRRQGTVHLHDCPLDSFPVDLAIAPGMSALRSPVNHSSSKTIICRWHFAAISSI